ncbi:MAG: hypothetical protein ACKVVP_11830 [Chloroflexota bacterium]
MSESSTIWGPCKRYITVALPIVTIMIERITEKSADVAAAIVRGIQNASARRRAFSPGGLARRLLDRIARAISVALKPRPAQLLGTGSSAALGLLHLLTAGGAPTSASLSRKIYSRAVQMAPVIWGASRDPRTRAIGAVLLRVVFGHTRRRSGR